MNGHPSVLFCPRWTVLFVTLSLPSLQPPFPSAVWSLHLAFRRGQNLHFVAHFLGLEETVAVVKAQHVCTREQASGGQRSLGVFPVAFHIRGANSVVSDFLVDQSHKLINQWHKWSHISSPSQLHANILTTIYVNMQLWFLEPVHVCVQPLTDSRFGAGKAAVFRHQVCVVAFAGQNLQHVSQLLSRTLFGPLVHSKANICSVTGKLPPGITQKPKSTFWPQILIGWCMLSQYNVYNLI